MVTSGAVLVVDGEVDGHARTSVRVRGSRIVAVGKDLRPAPGDRVVSASGGAVIPGLHDHHVHLRAMAAARSSVILDPAAIAASGGPEAALRKASGRLAPGAWLRGVGAYGAAIEAWDRFDLDRSVADRPVRLQHRGGALWLLNSRGIEALGVEEWPDEGVERFPDGTATGRLWRLDHQVGRLDPMSSDSHGDVLARISQEALRFGISGFTDATPGRTADDFDNLAGEVHGGRIHQRLMLMVDAAPAVPPGGKVTAGPHKVILDDARLALDQLIKTIEAAHGQRTAVAVHAVTADQLVVTCAAFEAAGSLPGDRIEHASVVPPGYAKTLAAQGICVVTQPGFLWHRGDDYLRDVDAVEQEWLYPCASLHSAGVPVGGSSDAPFGPLDPWLGMRAAIDRRSASGAVVGLDERCTAAQALAMYVGRAEAPGTPRRLAVGELGDLCVLRVPLAEALRDPGSHQVAAVVIEGEVFAWAS